MPPVTVRVVARGPVKSKGPEAINRQLDTFKAAIQHSGAAVEEAFVPVLAPGWLDHFIFNPNFALFRAQPIDIVCSGRCRSVYAVGVTPSRSRARSWVRVGVA